jgi:hypothetical protein
MGNVGSHVYHLEGDPHYGKTKAGMYECKSTAEADGARAPGTGKKASGSASTAKHAHRKHHEPNASPTP